MLKLKISQKRAKGSKDHEKVDLHGMTLAEACRFLDGRIEQWFSARSRQLDLEVVTGKGLHTKGKAVGILCREVHGYLCRKHGKLIHEIETSPDAVRLDGVPDAWLLSCEVSKSRKILLFSKGFL